MFWKKGIMYTKCVDITILYFDFTIIVGKEIQNIISISIYKSNAINQIHL